MPCAELSACLHALADMAVDLCSGTFTTNPPLISSFYCFSVIMSISSNHIAKCCARSLRSSSRPTYAVCTQRQRTAPSRRWESTAAASNPKISTIVDQIGQLTLLETADLVSTLKVSPLFHSVAGPPGSLLAVSVCILVSCLICLSN